MSKRVEFFLRAAPGLCHRRLVINRYPGAGEAVGAPVVDVILDEDATSFSCVLPENKMWQAKIVDSKPSGTRSTHSVVFNTATNRRVDPKDEVHSSSFRLSSIQDSTETPLAPVEPIAVDPPVVLPAPAVEPSVDTEAAAIEAETDEAVENEEVADAAPVDGVLGHHFADDVADHVEEGIDPSDDADPSDI